MKKQKDKERNLPEPANKKRRVRWVCINCGCPYDMEKMNTFCDNLNDAKPFVGAKKIIEE